MGLHLLIAGICFLGSAFFSDGKKGLAFSAGIPSLMFVLNMLANAGKNTEYIKDFTFFTLFDPIGLVQNEGFAYTKLAIMVFIAVLLYLMGIFAFSKKDLHV